MTAETHNRLTHVTANDLYWTKRVHPHYIWKVSGSQIN